MSTVKKKKKYVKFNIYYDKRSCYGPSGSLSSSRNILVRRIAQLTPDLSIELPVSLQYGCPQSLDVAV